MVIEIRVLDDTPDIHIDKHKFSFYIPTHTFHYIYWNNYEGGMWDDVGQCWDEIRGYWKTVRK